MNIDWANLMRKEHKVFIPKKFVMKMNFRTDKFENGTESHSQSLSFKKTEVSGLEN